MDGAAPVSRRGVLGTLRTAPWVRAPTLLVRAPGVVVALVLATAVLGVAAASGPLFLSSVGSATLTQQADAACVETSRPGLSNPAANDGVTPGVDFYFSQTGVDVDEGTEVVSAAMREAGLPAPYRVLQADAQVRPGTDSVNGTLTLFSRPDALDHVEVVDGEPTGTGVWITDRYAAVRGLQVGDPLPLAFGEPRIVGIYRDLAGRGVVSDLPAYWCSWSDLIVPSLEKRPPPFVLVDQPTLYGLVPVFEQPDASAPEIRASWYSAVDAAGLTATEAAEVVARADTLVPRVRRLGADTSTRGGGYERTDRLADYVAAAEQAQASVRGPVIPVAVAGTAVALLLLTAAGSLWVEQRAREVTLLRSRGVAAGPIGVKALLEMSLPIAVGAVLGWAAGLGLTRLLAPSPLLEPEAVRTAAATVAEVAAAGLVALAVLAAIRSGGGVDRPARRRFRLVLLPWELAFLAAAVVVYRGTAREGGARVFGATVSLDGRLVAFPMLALLGGLLLTARVVAWTLPRLRRRSSRWSPALWLSIRRVTGSVAATLTVFVLAAVPIGVLVYSAGLTGSLTDSVTAKGLTYTGAEQALDLRSYVGIEPTPDLSGVGTFVNVDKAVFVGRERVQVLGIEPDRFARFSGLDATPTGTDPSGLLASLADADHDGPVPAILVNGAGLGPLEQVRFFRTVVNVRIVATASSFPGRRFPNRPMLVVDRADLGDDDRYADRQVEVWTDNDHLEAVLARFNAEDVQISRTRTPDLFLGATDLLPITWTFGYLQTIAALTGLIAVTALLLYLAARQRQRLASYHLSRRMGETSAGNLRSLVSEVGAILLGAWLAGATLGIVCVGLVYRLLDLNPTFPPDPLFAPPVGLLSLTLLGVAAATLVTAGLAHAASRASAPGDVLRGH